MSEIEIPVQGEDDLVFKAYVAHPAPENLPAPAVIMIQEIFGVNEEMRQKCDDMAALGYIAVCPDLFWRQEEGVDLDDTTEAQWQRAFELMNNFDQDLGIQDLYSTMMALRANPNCTGSVGCVGYCLGGRLAFMMACRTDIDCAVSYYGVGLDNLLPEADNIYKPVMLHVAEKDEYVPAEAQDKIFSGLEDHPQITSYLYEGMDHAFARGNGIHYDEEAAGLANERTEEFLQSHIGLRRLKLRNPH